MHQCTNERKMNIFVQGKKRNISAEFIYQLNFIQSALSCKKRRWESHFPRENVEIHYFAPSLRSPHMWYSQMGNHHQYNLLHGSTYNSISMCWLHIRLRATFRILLCALFKVHIYKHLIHSTINRNLHIIICIVYCIV